MIADQPVEVIAALLAFASNADRDRLAGGRNVARRLGSGEVIRHVDCVGHYAAFRRAIRAHHFGKLATGTGSRGCTSPFAKTAFAATA